jgi:hypothetical protein
VSHATILGTLLEVLKNVQELCGREWVTIPATAKPIGALAGFDSLCSIETTVLVEQKLGCSPLGPSSLFISEDGKRALTLQEVSQRIDKMITAQGKP